MSANATIWTDLRALYNQAALVFGLPPHTLIEPLMKKPGLLCDGMASPARRGSKPCIWLRVHRTHRPRQALKRSTIMATFAHEMAHLLPNCFAHGPEHLAKTKEIAEWLRARGEVVYVKLNRGTHPGISKHQEK